MSETLLVTGGCGYIGSHVVRQLSQAGYRCIVIDDLSNGNSKALLHGETLIRADYADKETLDRIFTENKIAAILHFAAFISVEESVRQPERYLENNYEKTRQLLDIALAHGVNRIVFSSTAAVYGTSDALKSLVETDPLRPTNPYGESKFLVERQLEDLRKQRGLQYIILRYFNVAGAQGQIGQYSKEATHLIKLLCQTTIGVRSKFQIYGDSYPTRDGTCIRDYIHVEDLAAAHVLALRRLLERPDSLTLNCGYGTGYSVKEVLSAMEKVSGQTLPVEIAPRRAGDVPYLVAANEKIIRELGWKPQFADLNLILRSALAWEKKLFGKS